MASTEPVPAAAIEEILGILSAPDADLQEIVGLSREVCGVDAAGITLRYGDLLHVPVTNGLAPLVCDAVETFCAQTMDSDDIFHVEDAREDERFRDIGWVNGQLANLRFYASAPIYALDTMVGRLCVVDTHPKVLSAVQRRTLETLALSVTKVIELHLLRARRSEPGTLDVRQAAATLMSQLSAELTHDLRVPLSAIVAGVEMLTETVGDHPDPTVPALLHRTTRAADRMMRMLDTSMEFDAISPEPTRRDVDLARLAKQLVLDSVALVESTGATVELGDLPVVHADPDDMYSVLQNLVTNAVKFARPDVPARVVVSGHRVEDGWRVSVADNGVGIPEDRRLDVFSLFSRVDSHVEGHGIGLATVARIVTSHDGRVGIDDVPGGGVEVWFELPDLSTELV